ncbi:MAG: hypothetical protein Q4C82_09220, partial [Eubacteriales bacterium]|nr:hypothetical protein [Eubacteriales bacterium]
MSIFCFCAGLLCILYFIVLMIYSGLTSAFYLVWPLMGATLLVLGWLFRIQFFLRLPAAVRIALLVFTAAGALFFLGVEGMILRAAFQSPAPSLDYAVVLGAHVRASGPSRALALRLDAALDYGESPPPVKRVARDAGYKPA